MGSSKEFDIYIYILSGRRRQGGGSSIRGDFSTWGWFETECAKVTPYTTEAGAERGGRAGGLRGGHVIIIITVIIT